jgi:hypothetical protein
VINARDVVTGIYCAWRLLLFDRSAIRYLDSTVGGFWKSFYAAVIALPGVFILRVLFVDANPDLVSQAGSDRIAMVFALDYVYQWILFPLLMVYIAEAIGRRRQYVTFIVARNWSQVIQIAIILPPAVIIFAGGSDDPGARWLLLVAAHLVTWVYGWFIARTVLDISGMAAALIVLAELVVSVVVSIVSELLIGAV